MANLKMKNDLGRRGKMKRTLLKKVLKKRKFPSDSWRP